MARPLYVSEALSVELDAAVYAFDATTIELCLSVYPWAPLRSAKATIKMRARLDLLGSIPSFIGITDGKTQIWIAVCTYVLIAIIKKRLHVPHSFYEILQILSLTIFETVPTNQLLTPPPTESDADSEPQQLVLL